MPLTLPAHAAAALPFWRLTPRWLDAHALVIGCCAPDLAYLVAIPGDVSHNWLVGPICSAVVGLLVFVACELVLFPSVIVAVPAIARIDVAALLRPSWPTNMVAWIRVAAALVFGAFTHVAWDGATHAGWWPAVLLFQSAATARLAWVASTLIGSAVVLAVVYRRFGSTLWFHVRPLGWRMMVTTAVTTASAFAIGLGILAPDPVVPRWPAQMVAIRVGAFTLLACSLLESRLHSRRST